MIPPFLRSKKSVCVLLYEKIERNFREKKKGQFRTVLFCIALTLAPRLLLLRDTTQRTITPPRFARKVLISPPKVKEVSLLTLKRTLDYHAHYLRYNR